MPSSQVQMDGHRHFDADFIGKGAVAMVLGNNIFREQDLKKRLLVATEKEVGATVFGYYVDGPERFGIVKLNEEGKLCY